MTFLAPQALWLLALLPVVVALHYLRARRRQRDVAALFLWRRAQANSARRKRISPSWLLALQLMFIAAASVGVAGPRLTAAADDGVIIVIDGSASMAAAAEVDAAAGTRLRRTLWSRMAWSRASDAPGFPAHGWRAHCVRAPCQGA